MLLRCFSSHGARNSRSNSRLRLRFAQAGFPIRTSPDQRLVTTSPKRIAGSRVLHRLTLPRHPPYTLSCSYPKTIDEIGEKYLTVSFPPIPIFLNRFYSHWQSHMLVIPGLEEDRFEIYD